MKRALIRRLRVKYAACAAILCTAIALLTGAAPVSAAQSSTAPIETVSVTVAKTTPLTALPRNASPQLRVNCGPALNEYDRTQACGLTALIFTFYNDKLEPIGATIAGLVQYMHLNVRGKDWTEEDTVTSVSSKGETAPIDFTMTAVCGSPCVASAHLSGVLRTGDTGHVSYRDEIGENEYHITDTDYTLPFEAPPFVTIKIPVWNFGLNYRCDNGVAVTGTGCIFPEYKPDLDLSLKKYGAAAAMYLWAQDNMKAHWGAYPNGGKLTRLKDDDQAEKNYEKLCKGFKNIPGIGAPGDKDSCDEFPFAKTYQSGAGALGKEGGAGCVQAYAVRTADTGTEAEQWGDVTIQRRPNLRAPCIRGHIPGKLNSGAGGAYGAFIQNVRLFNAEPFFVIVTA